MYEKPLAICFRAVKPSFVDTPRSRSLRAKTKGNGSNRILIIVQNLPVPFDRRVWLECRTLTRAGYQVSVVCPKVPEILPTRSSRESRFTFTGHIPQGAVPLNSSSIRLLVHRHSYAVAHGSPGRRLVQSRAATLLTFSGP